ncbi:MAG: hypothetical protein LBE36_03350 [Flavobacteriaceae bacterium]|jgi:hypothetical protein|nr:hypothetical protein [Flavobacteriaceae bacterium]
MKFTLDINHKKITFQRNWFTGNFTYSIDGTKKTLQSALNPFTHFSTEFSKTYEVRIDDTAIIIVKTRPFLFAGFRAHNYKFFIDGNLVKNLDSM